MPYITDPVQFILNTISVLLQKLLLCALENRAVKGLYFIMPSPSLLLSVELDERCGPEHYISLSDNYLA